MKRARHGMKPTRTGTPDKPIPMCGLFGWSLPPGCGRLPGEEPDPPCELCGRFEDDCICPECTECGERADPRCYRPRADGGCGMTRTPEQVASLTAAEKEWTEQARAEAEADQAMEREWESEDKPGKCAE